MALILFDFSFVNFAEKIMSFCFLFNHIKHVLLLFYVVILEMFTILQQKRYFVWGLKLLDPGHVYIVIFNFVELSFV